MKAVSFVFHDVIKNNDLDSSGFLGPEASIYKLDYCEMEKHLMAIANSTTHNQETVYKYLSKVNRRYHLPIFLTFDDGGNSAALYISELLDKYGLIGHIFITTSRIGTPHFLDKSQIIELKKRGHVIGSHSWSHPDRMSFLNWKDLVMEWQLSVNQLNDIVGDNVTVASVPGGYYSNNVAKAASACGIEALFTSEPIKKCYYIENCLVLGRYSIISGMTPRNTVGLCSEHISIPQLKQYMNWNIKKLAKFIGGRHYLKSRKYILKYYMRNH